MQVSSESEVSKAEKAKMCGIFEEQHVDGREAVWSKAIKDVHAKNTRQAKGVVIKRRKIDIEGYVVSEVAVPAVAEERDSIAEIIRKFEVLDNADVNISMRKKCLNCGSLNVACRGKAAKNGENRARCQDCNKDFSLKYTQMFYAVCNSVRRQEAVKVVQSAGKIIGGTDDTKKAPVLVKSVEKTIGGARKSSLGKTIDGTRKISVERAELILTRPVIKKKVNVVVNKKLSFIYTNNMPRNNFGLLKSALMTKIPSLSTRNISNIDFVGKSLTELLVDDSVVEAVKKGLTSIGLDVCDFNPAGTRVGKESFKKRMLGISKRPSIHPRLRALSESFAIADDTKLSALLAGCGIKVGDTTASSENVLDLSS